MNLQRLIERYISYQRSLGLSFNDAVCVLRAFGRARGRRASVAGVRVRHVDAFLGKARPVTRTWFKKVSYLRGLFQYAVSRGYATTAPLPTIMPKRSPAFVPYIYSREEIRRLLQVIAPPRRGRSLIAPATIRTMILVYYGAGLRRGEAINLTRADVDLSASVLTIRDTKFGKTRLVPVGPQLTRVLVEYDRTQPKGRPADASFFATVKGSPLHARTVESNFRIACERASIRRTDTRQQPRIHDLRHTFAVHRLTSWYQEGADVQRLLHHLSVYLGHAHLQDTQVYLSMTPELLREASQRFEHYAGKGRCHV
ncbi:MAG: tyrosine-type recombinase/integrase [Pirellulaceae bacterium]